MATTYFTSDSPGTGSTKKEIMESMIDTSSLEHVLCLIADICSEKSNHVADNWEDRSLSRAWLRASVPRVSAKGKFKLSKKLLARLQSQLNAINS